MKYAIIITVKLSGCIAKHRHISCLEQIGDLEWQVPKNQMDIYQIMLMNWVRK